MASARELSPAKRALLDRYRKGTVAAARAGALNIGRRPEGVEAPISAGQRQLWLHAQVTQNPIVYNEPVTIHRTGPCEVHILERCFEEVVRRHEAWRTGIVLRDGQLLQRIQEPYAVRLPFVDLRSTPIGTREQEATRLATADARRPFDLTRAPLWRCLVVQMGPEEYRLYLTIHHIIFDVLALYQALIPELAALYDAFSQGLPSPLPPLPLQFADFAWWESQHQTDDRVLQGIEFWRNELPTPLPALQLPTDRPAPTTMTYRGSLYPLALSREQSAALREFARREGVTLFNVFLSALFVVLHRYSGQGDLLIGSVTAGRKTPELEKLLGYFLHTLVLRGDVAGNPTFRELLQRVRARTIGALTHDDVPFDQLVRALQPSQDIGKRTLFNVSFSLEPPPPLLPAGWRLTLMDVATEAAKFDLYLELDDRSDGIVGRFGYNAELFTAQTIERLAGHWNSVLIGVLQDPEQRVGALPLLTEREREQALCVWAGAERAYAPVVLPELFEQQVAKTPNALALRDDRYRFTYRELDERANQLAHYLRANGVDRGVMVAVCLNRSANVVVALLGILKAGGAYVPLDPAYPPARLAYLMKDAQTPVALTEQALVDRLPSSGAAVVLLDAVADEVAHQPTTRLPVVSEREDPAYVIYTSGSTGQPKGVVVAQRGVANLLQYSAELFQLGEGDRLLQRSSLSFDASVWEIFLPLVCGAELVYPEENLSLEPKKLIDAVRTLRITDLKAPPAVLRLLLAEPTYAHCTSLKRVYAGGEALPNELVRLHFGTLPTVELYNCYGPSEVSVDASFWRCSRADKGAISPLGLPLANTALYVVDQYMQPVPVGVPGELCVAGVGLALGYLRRPELTAERFVRNPFSADPDARLYRTGDLARYRADGVVEFLGRSDSQIKIRGYRVETGEIETALLGHSAIRDVVVVSRDVAPNDTKLVAYLVARGDSRPTPDELRQYLGATLPDYMLPNVYMWLSELPLLPSKKIDRAALPTPAIHLPALQKRYVAPQTALERTLVDIWAHVLGQPHIGIRDNFFDLGGHSLLAARVFAEIERRLGTRMPLAALFVAGTVERLAQLIERGDGGARQSSVIPIQASGSLPPLFIVPGAGSRQLYLRHLARRLGPAQPVYTLFQSLIEQRATINSVEALAAVFREDVQRVQPQGPYYLAGHSFGGMVAYELAQQLLERGESVAMLAMFDVEAPGNGPVVRWSRLATVPRRLGMTLRLSTFLRREQFSVYARMRLTVARERISERLYRDQGGLLSRLWSTVIRGAPVDVQHSHEQDAARLLALQYRPKPYAGSVDLFWAHTSPIPLRVHDARRGWSALAQGGVRVHPVPGDHLTLLLEPLVEHVARQLAVMLHANSPKRASRQGQAAR